MTDRRRTYFLSDLHLGANYIANPREHEQLIVSFLQSIEHDAQEIYLVGDIIDYWYEYKHVVPRGYVRFFGQLARLADAGVKIYWFTGNHDVWLFDYLRDEIGLTVIKRNTVLPIMGKNFLISHGDDVGHQPLIYRFMRWCFHNKVCQVLYASVHPRWTFPLAHGWSSSNRTGRSQDQVDKGVEKSIDHLKHFVEQHAATHSDVYAYIFGHLHVARDITVAGDRRMIVLGEWMTQYTYCTFDGEHLELHTFAPTVSDKTVPDKV